MIFSILDLAHFLYHKLWECFESETEFHCGVEENIPYGIGCRIDQIGIARPIQPNKQP